MLRLLNEALAAEILCTLRLPAAKEEEHAEDLASLLQGLGGH